MRFTYIAARYHGQCRGCQAGIIPGDTVMVIYPKPTRTLCRRCGQMHEARQATALDHRISAHTAQHRLTAPDD